MSGVVTGLRARGRHGNRVEVVLDGMRRLVVERKVAERLELGQRLSDEDLAALESVDAEEKAYRLCLGLVARRPRSRRELSSYLARRGLPPESAERIMSRLAGSGWVDDRTFARAWVENRREFRPRGSRALRVELRRKGVTPEDIAAALEGHDEGQAALRAARRAARRWKDLPEELFRQRLAGHLSARGFDFEMVRAATERAWREVAADRSEDSPWKDRE